MRFTALAAVLIFVLVNPTPVSNASDRNTPAPPSTAQVERDGKIALVRGELEPKLTKATPKEAHDVSVAIVDECTQHGIDPLFVLAIIESESNFDIEAVSPTGARGLMQIIPATFRQVSDAKRMFDPVENVRAGIRYINKIRVEYRFKDPETYLFAYNQGPGAVVAHYKDGAPMADEAQMYIPRVMAKYRGLLVKYGYKPQQAKKLFLASR